MMKTIPMFPLAILPLPGELVPLHIFEPRYRQLLQEAETDDISFGIFFNHVINTEKVGSLVRLESMLKRYPTGESDIIVKCHDNFTLDMLYRTYQSKLYPGGDVNLWNVKPVEIVSSKVEDLFREYLLKRNITRQTPVLNPYMVALELNLELNDRYNFLIADKKGREAFLVQRIKYQLHLLQQEDRSKDVFHLN